LLISVASIPHFTRVQCEAHVERLAQMALPSLGRFDAKSADCVAAFDARCVGPAATAQAARLAHALAREKARFRREYNDRLYGGLVVASLAAAIVSRFVLKRLVLEVVGWGSFIFLEARSALHCMLCKSSLPAPVRHQSSVPAAHAQFSRAIVLCTHASQVLLPT
jgi:hypothetical protein